MLVIVLSIGIPLIGLMWRSALKGHHRFVRAVEGTKPLPPDWKTDQAWRQPTDIGFIENLKGDLTKRESYLNKSYESCRVWKERRGKCSTGLGRFLFHFWNDTQRSAAINNDDTHAAARNLILKLDRIWAGNAHLEIEDCREQIRTLNRRRQDVPEDYEKKSKLRSIDESVIAWERRLSDLQEVVARAQKRAQMQPQEAAYKDTRSRRELDMHHTIAERFHDVRTRMETVKVRDALIKQVQTDPSLTDEEKETLIRETHRVASETLSPGQDPTAIPIYKKEA